MTWGKDVATPFTQNAVDVPDGSYVLKIQSTDYQTESTNIAVSGGSVTQDVSMEAIAEPTGGDDGGDDTKEQKKDTPGFEIIAIIGAALIILVLSRRGKKNNL